MRSSSPRAFLFASIRPSLFFLPFLLLLSLAVQKAYPQSAQSSDTGAESTKERFSIALDAFRHQEYTKAERELKSLLASEPDNFAINELAGLVYVAEDEFQKANPYLSKAVQLKPRASEARTALAANLLRLHRTAEAEAEFKKVVNIAPMSYDANHNLGEFYLQTGNVTAAVPFLKRAQEIDRAAYNNGYDLALAYEQTNRFDEARQVLLRLVAVHDSAELHSLLGEVEEKSKNYLEAAKEYEKAARIEPSETSILNWGAELLLHQTFEPAAEVFRAGLIYHPGSVRLQYGLGIALYGMGHYDDAAREFFQAADRNPSDPLPLTFLGKAYDNLSPQIAAGVRARLKSFIDRNTANAAARFYYALCLRKVNQAQQNPELTMEAESLLKNAVALDPSYAEAYLQLGILYADQQRFREAIAQYQEALRLNPGESSIHYRLGQALARTGEAERAKQEFAFFERLRESKVEEENKEHNQIQQFVYTMRKKADDQ